jgi:hypothetical protein
VQIEFPFIKMSLFDSEFNSASNGETFIHGKTIGKILPGTFSFPVHAYVSSYGIEKETYVCRSNSRSSK